MILCTEGQQKCLGIGQEKVCEKKGNFVEVLHARQHRKRADIEVALVNA